MEGFYSGQALIGNTNLISNGPDDHFLTKINQDGIFIWTKSIVISLYYMDDTWFHSLETDEAGNVYITGWFMDTLIYDDLIIPSHGSYDIFILKIDGNGDLLWILSAGNTHSYGDYSRSIARSPDGSLYITGRFYDELWFGDNSVTSYGSADVFIAKIHEEPVSVVYDAPAQEIAVYPNPAHGYVNIALPGGDISKAELTDLRGKTVRSWQKPVLYRLDVSGIAKNGYIIKIYINNMVYTKKIIIY
ncbi:MAG: T9SS type A sorting domain-containing protein [Bacteroidia bacterium]|nr:T9SS type A sorting domain-containing protein [Bacteroidia bacterium]